MKLRGLSDEEYLRLGTGFEVDGFGFLIIVPQIAIASGNVFQTERPDLDLPLKRAGRLLPAIRRQRESWIAR
jgi:hypothetical protein